MNRYHEISKKSYLAIEEIIMSVVDVDRKGQEPLKIKVIDVDEGSF